MATITSKTSKNVQVEGIVMVDGERVKGFNATISTDNPNDINMSNWIINQELYKANRAAINTEQSKLEDDAYAEQDRLIIETQKGEEK